MDGIRRIQKISTQISPAPTVASSTRRFFLKYLLLGSGALVIGKLLSPSLSLFLKMEERTPLAFKDFRVIEKEDTLQFFDKSGHELFTFDKTA